MIDAYQAKKYEQVEHLYTEALACPEAHSVETPNLQLRFFAVASWYWAEKAKALALRETEQDETDAVEWEWDETDELLACVERLYAGLDAAGAPNPTVHEALEQILAEAGAAVCRVPRNATAATHGR
jgi:hypothetical protein